MYNMLPITLLIGLNGIPLFTSRIGLSTHSTYNLITKASGLKYYTISNSKSNKKTQVGDVLTVHYTAWLADSHNDYVANKKFDSTFDRNKPYTCTLGVGRVIPGWDEGLMSMREGEKRRLIIPSDLAYGSRGAGNYIPPNATLIFDVELLSIR